MLLLHDLYIIANEETKNSDLFDKNCTQEKPQENAMP